MSSSTKPLTLARVSDMTIGAFGFAPSSETLDHVVRFLSTWSGSDKLFMVIQYALKIVIPFLNLRTRLQHRAGMRKEATSSVSTSLSKLYSIIGDSRMLWRLWGLLPIYQWLTTLERMPPPTRRLLTIERLQGWSMIAYYPLEHLYYLRANSILPAALAIPFFKSLKLDIGKLGLWSTRFWAAYVFLQFAHLREDHRLLKLRERSLSKVKGKAKATENEAAEKAELEGRWDALCNELVVNLGYLPLTVHWSLEKGLFKNEIWVGVFGLIAGLASFRSGWKATALPAPTASGSDAHAADANSNLSVADSPLSLMDSETLDDEKTGSVVVL